MARSDRKQREFERREEDILDAALALCSTHEFESVTVEQIAEQAGIGKGTVYKHFSSKDELFFRINIRFYKGLLKLLRESYNDLPPLEQFRQIIEQSFHYHLDNKEYRYIVEYCDRIDFMERAESNWRDDFLALDRAFMEWGEPLIQAGIDAGVFEDRPVSEIMLGMHACFEGAVTMLWTENDWCPISKNANAKDLIQAITNFILAGLIGIPKD